MKQIISEKLIIYFIAMKKYLMFFFGSALLYGTVSCGGGRPVARQISDNNETYKVDYLFEHDGCKVYRFYDQGSYVYFTNCTGDVTAISTDSVATRIETHVKRIR